MGAPENVGHLQQLGGTRLVTLQDGVERGVRVVEFRTAAGLDFGVLVDRAMDIAWCRYNGRSISWLSPVGLIGPWYREPEGLGFLRTFQGGLLVTCGLDPRTVTVPSGGTGSTTFSARPRIPVTLTAIPAARQPATGSTVGSRILRRCSAATARSGAARTGSWKPSARSFKRARWPRTWS